MPKVRAADIAHDRIESLIATLQLTPGAPIVEADLVAMTGLGRTPVREALLRMVANGLIVQLPRRGLIVSDIQPAEHLSLIETRRVLERLIVTSAARRALPEQRREIQDWAKTMVAAAEKDDLTAYMAADQGFDHVMHEACRNPSAVAAVIPLIIKCRRFWYAFKPEGEITEDARCHQLQAMGIATGDSEMALQGVDGLMDLLEAVTRRVIDV